jgi:ribonuclease HIII
MVYSPLNNCAHCADINTLIKEIDCKVFQLSIKVYNNLVYLLNNCVNEGNIKDLLHYKNILLYKMCNPKFAGDVTVEVIANRIKFLN